MGNSWSENEIKILKEFYHKTNDIEIINYFSGRTLTSIKLKAKRLKIYRDEKIKKINRSNSNIGIKNGMYGKTSKIKGKSYDTVYGKEKSREIRKKLSKSKVGKLGLSGKKNGMYGKIPYNKGVSPNDEIKRNIKNGIINYWKNLSDSDLEKRKNQLRKDWIIKRDKYSEIDTLPEKITEELLLKLGFDYMKKMNVGYYNCDFIINNKIIEVQGDYWHGNTKFYNSFDKIQNKNIKRDKRKLKFLHGEGFEVLYLWEHDLKTNINFCEKQIKEYLL